MEENEGIPTYSRKMRQKPSKNRSRLTPYSRYKGAKGPKMNDEAEGLLGKVTNMIVPTWISSWWKPDSVENNDESSNDSVDGDVEVKLNGELPSHVEAATLSATKVTLNDPGLPVANKTDILSTLSSKTEYNLSTSKSEEEPLMNPFQSNKRKVSDLEEIKEDVSKSTSFYESYRHRKTSASNNKPAFKVSAFMSPVDQPVNVSFNASALNASSFDFSMQRSPFYTGGTTFGGASSFRETSGKRIKLSPVSNKVRTTRTQVRAKPLSNSKKNVVTSQTAKRILSTLGKMSSPVKDSKRIQPSIFDSPSFSEMVRNKAKNIQEDKSTAPPTKQLVSKKSVDVAKTFVNKSETIKRFNEKIIVKQQVSVPSKPAEPLFNKPHQSSIQPIMPPSTISSAIHVTKTTLKMKREKTTVSHFSSNIDKEEVVNTMPEITSASIALPITALPKFNFSVKQNIRTAKPVSSIFSPSVNVTPIPKASEKPIQSIFKSNLQEQNTSPVKTSNFVFTTPEVLQTTKETLLTSSPKGFAFSSPIDLIKPTKIEEKTEIKETVIIKPLKALKKLVSSEGSWDCPTCFINNQREEIECIACGASNPTSVKSNSVKQLKTLTKVPNNSWSCPTCYIDNNQDDQKCAACSEPNPSNKSVCVTTPQIKIPIKTLSKLPKVNQGTWSCLTCFVDNEKDSLECSACTTAKPILNDKIENELKNDTFITPKPGVKNDDDAAPLNQGKQLKKKFGLLDNNTWSCPTCMIDNDNEVTLCAACSEPKPGKKIENKSNDPSCDAVSKKNDISGFKFGSSSSSSTSGFNFGNNSSAGFKFGTANAVQGNLFNNKSEEKTEKGFKFGTSGSSGFSFGNSSETTQKEVPSGLGAFSAMSSSKIDNTTSIPIIDLKEKENTSQIQPTFPSIAEAAKSGFLKVQGVGEPEASSSITKSTAPPFNFGAPKVPDNSSQMKAAPTNGFTTGAGFSFGSPASAPLFRAEPDATKVLSKNTPAPSFNFGSSAKTEPKGGPTFNFGSVAKTESSSIPLVSPFNFVSATKTESGLGKATSNFGSTNKTESTTEKPTINFDSTPQIDSSSSTSAPSFNFGATVTSAPLFNLGTSNTSKVEAQPPSYNFGNSNVSAPISEANLTSSSTNVFGNTASKLSTSIFGAGSSQPSATFNFGTKSTLPTFETKPSGFSLSSANSSLPESNGPAPAEFSFSSGTAPLFNMGTSNKRSLENDKTNSIFGATPAGEAMFNQPNTFDSSKAGPTRRPIKRAVRKKNNFF